MTSFYELLTDHGPLDAIELTYDHHVRKPVYVARTFLDGIPVGFGKDKSLKNAIDDALTDDGETLNTPPIPPVGKIADWLREHPGRAYVVSIRKHPVNGEIGAEYTHERATVYDTDPARAVDYEKPLY